MAQGAHFSAYHAGRKQTRLAFGRKKAQVGLNAVDKQNIEGVVVVSMEPYPWF